MGGFESPTVTSVTLGYIGCLSQSQKAKKLEEKKGVMRRREFLRVTVGGPTAVIRIAAQKMTSYRTQLPRD